MPHVNIRIFESAYTKQQKQVAAAKITEAIVTTLNKNASHTEIHFIKLNPENILVAGKNVPAASITAPSAKAR